MTTVNDTLTTETTAETTPATPDIPAVTVLASAPATTDLVAAFATTPKRGKAKKPPKEPYALLAYAIEQGGTVVLDAATKQALASRGLREDRIGNAAYGVRRFFGKTVIAIRTGRAVTAYRIEL